MADSLQEQLRKAGLVNEKKLKKAQRVKHAQEMERKGHGAADDLWNRANGPSENSEKHTVQQERHAHGEDEGALHVAKEEAQA